MKRVFLLLTVLIYLHLNSFSQCSLFKGIKSGMTPSEFINNVKSNPDFVPLYLPDTAVITVLGEPVLGKMQYLISPSFNSDNLLYAITMSPLVSYDTSEFFEDEKIAIELYTILKVKYGEGYHVRFPEHPIYIPEYKPLIVIFKKDNIKVALGLFNKYGVGLVITNINYEDTVSNESSYEF